MSNIEWTDMTWNPVTGCSKVSPGCAHCYAEALSLRFGTSKKSWTPENAAENVVLHPERLDAPLHWKKPRRVFVNSMSDLFHEQVPTDFIVRVFEIMASAQRHTFQVLTKRPERMLAFMRGGVDPVFPDGWPLPNVWLGVSVENQHWADERIPLLLQTPAAVRFLSCEPLLGPVSLHDWLPRIEHYQVDGPMTPETYDALTNVMRAAAKKYGCAGPDWVIVGGESGPGARPMDVDWVRSIRDQCATAGVPLFVKQDSGQRPGHQRRIPDDLWRMKEFPRA